MRVGCPNKQAEEDEEASWAIPEVNLKVLHGHCRYFLILFNLELYVKIDLYDFTPLITLSKH